MPMSHIPLRYAHEEGHTDICYSEDGSKYITCGSDGDIRIWSQDLQNDPVHVCVGECALAIRQKGTKCYIATSSNDVQVIKFPDGDREEILDRFVAPVNNIAISQDSTLIALAGEEMVVTLVKYTNGEKQTQVFNELSGPCLSVAISPDSAFLAAAAGDQMLRIWNIQENSPIKEIKCFPKVNSFANAKILCKIDFDPVNGEYLAYPFEASVILLNTKDWSEEIKLTCDKVSNPFSIVQFSSCGKYLAASSIVGDFVVWEISSESVHDFSKHPNNKNVCAFMWHPKGIFNGQIVYTDTEGQLGVINNIIGEKETNEIKEVEDNDNEVDFGDIQFEDDNEDDDENVISIEKLKKQFEEEPEVNSIAENSRSPTPRAKTPEIPLQEPFMPSSSPAHCDPRYLCWNDVGIIRSYGHINDDDNGGKSIEIDFHDTMFHSSMMMQNFQDYTMGSVSKSVLVVANANQINVIPLSLRSKEWNLNMKSLEEIVCIASSDELVCVGLSNYLIRVCGCYGMQRAIFSVPGPLVSMAAFKNMILVAYHGGAVRNSDQVICFKLIKLEGTALMGQDLGSTLGPESSLLWLGFTDYGSPSAMDSLGMLHIFPLKANIWIPFCDTTKHRKGLSDSFFITSISETSQSLIGIKCKASTYPPVVPRPTMCEIPLEPPFAEMTTDKSLIESNLFTWNTLYITNTEKQIKEAALKLFALACKADFDQRGLEIMEILANVQIVNLGIKYASKLDKKKLVEKLNSLSAKILEDMEEDEPTYRNGQEIENIIPTNQTEKKINLSNKNTPNSKISASDLHIPNNLKHLEKSELISKALNNTCNTSIDSIGGQDSIIDNEEGPVNPFLKAKKKINDQNPLSLINKRAGVTYEEPSLKKDVCEKRKLEEADSEKQKPKQIKLQGFMFGKKRSN